MDDIKKIYDSILKKYRKVTDGHLGISFYWKAIVITYLVVFVLLLLSGWILYTWVITNNFTVTRSKIERPEITLEDINKAKESVAGRNEKLEAIIKNDVNAIELK